MTPLQLAKTECSNYIQETCGCQGLNIKDDGSLVTFPAPLVCSLHSKNGRCTFFEQIVLPLANSWRPPYIGKNTEDRHREGLEAVKLYRKSHGLIRVAERPCPICSKPMATRKQFCHECSKKRRLEQIKRAEAKRGAKGELAPSI